MQVQFAEGEQIHTENSYKYDLVDIDKLAEATGSLARKPGRTARNGSAAICCWQFEKTAAGAGPPSLPESLS